MWEFLNFTLLSEFCNYLRLRHADPQFSLAKHNAIQLSVAGWQSHNQPAKNSHGYVPAMSIKMWRVQYVLHGLSRKPATPMASCFVVHSNYGSERESDGTATFTQLSSPAEPRGTDVGHRHPLGRGHRGRDWFGRDAEGAGLRLNWAGHGERLDEGVGISGIPGL